jgi:hypothetical protein
MKAIKIDVEKNLVYFVEIDGGLESIYNVLGCTCITCPVQYENEDSMYCDDEALLNPENIKGAFMYPDWNYPIVSNALILGTDDEGNSVDCKSTLTEIANGLKFINIDNPSLIRYINQFT